MSYQATRAQGGNENDANHDASSQQFSVIDRHSEFDGTFRSDRDLRIDGKVKGAIECLGTLFVAQGAVVEAKVQAENIDVAGDLTGEIRCKGVLRLLPSARLRGEVFTAQLIVNDGANYEGKLEMAQPKAAPRRQVAKVNTVLASPVAVPHAVADDPAAGTSDPPSTFIRRLGGPETPWSAAEEAEANANGKSDPN